MDGLHVGSQCVFWVQNVVGACTLRQGDMFGVEAKIPTAPRICAAGSLAPQPRWAWNSQSSSCLSFPIWRHGSG